MQKEQADLVGKMEENKAQIEELLNGVARIKLELMNT